MYWTKHLIKKLFFYINKKVVLMYKFLLYCILLDLVKLTKYNFILLNLDKLIKLTKYIFILLDLDKLIK